MRLKTRKEYTVKDLIDDLSGIDQNAIVVRRGQLQSYDRVFRPTVETALNVAGELWEFDGALSPDSKPVVMLLE